MLFAVWSFASPSLLLWGVAAVVPIVIHLWSRQRFHETQWAATRFLLAAIERHRRRLQIEQWLLLAVRVSVLLLMAVALAEPVVSGMLGLGGQPRRPPNHTVVVIDTSYSMATEAAGQTRLERAKSRASEAVRAALPGDAYSLVSLADPSEVIVAEPSASHSAMLNEIQRLQISYRGADLGATLDHIERLLKLGKNDFEHQRVHLLSDLGKTTWTDDTTWQSRLDALSQRVELQLTDCSESTSPQNLAIESLSLGDSHANVGTPVSIDVSVVNYTNRSQRRRRVELLLDGKRVGEQFIDLEAGGRANARFPLSFDVAGDYVLQAAIDRDSLPVDDQRWSVVTVRDATRVLCIQGGPHAADYIAIALNAGDTSDSIIPEVTSERALTERDLSEYECVFVCNVARFSEEEARRLWRYVAQGGGLVFVLGDMVQSDAYNEAIGVTSKTPLLPATLNEVIGDRRYTFDPLEYRHPLTTLFRGHERSGLLTVPIWRYVRLDAIGESAAVAVAFGMMDPAIVTAEAGQGRVMLMATAASPESIDATTDPPTPWNALASWPSFPPLVHEALRFVSSERAAHRNVLVGEGLWLQSAPEVQGTSATLTAPDDTQLTLHLDGSLGKGDRAASNLLIREHLLNSPSGRVEPRRGEGDHAETSPRLGSTLLEKEGRAKLHDLKGLGARGTTRSPLTVANQPGVYQLDFDTRDDSPMKFAVNVATAESDLAAQNAEDFANLFNKLPTQQPSTIAASTSDVPLFRLALGAVLLLLLIETGLACRFGRAGQ